MAPMLSYMAARPVAPQASVARLVPLVMVVQGEEALVVLVVVLVLLVAAELNPPEVLAEILDREMLHHQVVHYLEEILSLVVMPAVVVVVVVDIMEVAVDLMEIVLLLITVEVEDLLTLEDIQII